MSKFSSWPNPFIPKPIEVEKPKLRLRDTEQGFVEIATEKNLSMYVCGITPYDATHLGHAATYLSFDLIYRYLNFSGVEISYVQNVTDVDDPLFERANRDATDWRSLGQGQVQLFADDMTYLRVVPPARFIAVSEKIDEFANAVNRLITNGSAYRLENDVYFDLSEFIPKLKISTEEAIKIFAERGGDPERNGKKTALDPILWCGVRKSEPSWKTILGDGRPGWHIECVVIASENLRSEKVDFSIDLQGGGSDLIFPHHFMCTAINQKLNQKKFARYYIHTGMLGLNGEKMSKSKGNLVFVSNYRKSGLDPMVLRWALIKDIYQSDRMWREENIQVAEKEINLLRTALSLQTCEPVLPTIRSCLSQISNNLDVDSSVKAILKWAHISLDSEKDSRFVNETGLLARFLDSVLGIAL
jgi:L-cysteine:1D-myo-inositol 2-amino-2-deoxy-alpha-D-glucopyranoside ligase